MFSLYLQAMAAKNKLGLFDFTMIVVSLVIGMGIFRTPANVAAASPTPAIFFIAWIAGGLVALMWCIDLCRDWFPVAGNGWLL